jgi:hypothetical protein
VLHIAAVLILTGRRSLCDTDGNPAGNSVSCPDLMRQGFSHAPMPDEWRSH